MESSKTFDPAHWKDAPKRTRSQETAPSRSDSFRHIAKLVTR